MFPGSWEYFGWSGVYFLTVEICSLGRTDVYFGAPGGYYWNVGSVLLEGQSCIYGRRMCVSESSAVSQRVLCVFLAGRMGTIGGSGVYFWNVGWVFVDGRMYIFWESG